jgi:hypothetical protein
MASRDSADATRIAVPVILVVGFGDGKVTTSTSNGTRPPCWLRRACLIRAVCPPSAQSRPRRCSIKTAPTTNCSTTTPERRRCRLNRPSAPRDVGPGRLPAATTAFARRAGTVVDDPRTCAMDDEEARTRRALRRPLTSADAAARVPWVRAPAARPEQASRRRRRRRPRLAESGSVARCRASCDATPATHVESRSESLAVVALWHGRASMSDDSELGGRWRYAGATVQGGDA